MPAEERAEDWDSETMLIRQKHRQISEALEAIRP